MFDNYALDASYLSNEDTNPTRPRRGIGAMLKAALESLVAAQSKQFEDTSPLLHGFPPL
jgi:hypothetical protein